MPDGAVIRVAAPARLGRAPSDFGVPIRLGLDGRRPTPFRPPEQFAGFDELAKVHGNANGPETRPRPNSLQVHPSRTHQAARWLRNAWQLSTIENPAATSTAQHTTASAHDARGPPPVTS